MNHTLPPFLRKGDTIAIACTARKVSPEELAPAVKVFESWGLTVRLSPYIYETNHQFAGTDAQRAEAFQQLMDDEEVKAIVCARGGYGTVRMIDLLDFSRFSASPKWIVGYSDVTVLHQHIYQHTSVCSLHATMPINMQAHNVDAVSVETLRKTLFGEALQYKVESHHLNRNGEAEGPLTGGNLSVIYSLLGSSSLVDTTGKILFLEDLDEYLYHIDRMMVALKRAGMLAGLKGLVIGSMSDMKDNTVPFGKQALDIISETVSSYHYPVMFGFPAGHEASNHSLIMGKRASLSVSSKEATLRFI